MRSVATALVLLVAIIMPALPRVSGKIIDHCDLFRQLKSKGASGEDATMWTCIAFHEATYNTAAFADHGNNFKTHGLFQILNQYWCSPLGHGCNMACSALLDDNIADDFECAKKIKAVSAGDGQGGWTAWSTYNDNCSGGRANAYVRGC